MSKRNKVFIMRITEEEYNKIKDTAKYYSVSMTDYVMNRVFAEHTYKIREPKKEEPVTVKRIGRFRNDITGEWETREY